MKTCYSLTYLMLLPLVLVTCTPAQPEVLRLATTTSTYDSGLLEVIAPAFELAYNVDLDIVAVGTGQAIALGEAGDVDVILVHARSHEDAFIQNGFGSERSDVMYNDFILVGPREDPAGIRGMLNAAEALFAVATAEAEFASRGDESGTHTRERQLWEAIGIDPTGATDWYSALGQGMGATLQFAHERGAYTLSDRGTFLALQAGLSNLEILVGGRSIDENEDPNLRNPYGVIAVNPAVHPGVASELAQQFVSWITSLEIQAQIGEFGLDTYGQPLFYPDSMTWREANP